MNPLTLVKRIQNINAKEADLGISDEASWHAKYKDSAYVFAGGFPYDLTEGDLTAVFAQYGEIVDVNLVRDKSTGKSKGFAFIAYEDQRSTVLAVDNLNGAQIGGRTIRVDHVAKYKKKEEEEEDEETKRQKREERGVCRAFQKGECKYGDSCKFSHDKQRAADTGWGPEQERKSRLAYGRSDDHSGDNKRSRDALPSRAPEPKQLDSYGGRSSGGKDTTEIGRKQREAGSGDQDNGHKGKRLKYNEDRDNHTVERRSRDEPESKRYRDDGGREEMKSRRHDSQLSNRDIRYETERDRGRDRDRDRDKEKRAGDGDRNRTRAWDQEKQSAKDYSYQHRREREDADHREARRDEDRHKSRR